MKKITTTIDHLYQNMHKNYDQFIVIVGKNRTGKSRLALHILEQWLTLIGKPITKDSLKRHMAITIEDFVNNLEYCLKTDEYYLPCIFDEAGQDVEDLRDKFNKVLRSAYSQIASHRLLTIFITTEIDILNKYFRQQRLTGLIRVTARGRCVYWNWRRITSLNRKNMYNKMFNYYATEPLWFDTYPDYKGVLLSQYNDLEHDKTKIMEELQSLLQEKKNKRIKKNRPSCPKCGGNLMYYRAKTHMNHCRICGHDYPPNFKEAII